MKYLQRKKRAFMSIVNSVKGFVRTISGVPPLMLEDCVDDKSVINYQIYGNSEQFSSILPEGYVPVEYIESNGTQYIDTNLILGSDYGFKVKCRYTDDRPMDGSTHMHWFFGSRVAAYDSAFGILFNYYGTPSSATTLNMMCLGSQVYEWASDYRQKDVTFELNDRNFYIDDSLVHTFNEEVFECKFPLYILWNNQNGTGESGRKPYGRIYYFTLYKNGEIVNDFVPCYRKSDNVIGMYDIITDTFHVNKGTDEFLKGDKITGEPSPDNPVEVVSVGEKTKNLFDGYLQNGNVIVSGGNITSSSNRLISNPIELPQGNYIVSTNSNTIIPRCHYKYDDNMQGLNKAEYTNKITIAEGERYVRVIFRRVDDSDITPEDVKDVAIMIEPGDTATEYEPYGYKIPVTARGKNLFDESLLLKNTSSVTKVEDGYKVSAYPAIWVSTDALLNHL